jgi:hypothetical protein
MPINAAQSSAGDAGQAIREIAAKVRQEEAAFILFFCSVRYDLKALAAEIRENFLGTPVIGCTTAGEFGPLGYSLGGIVAASFPAAEFTFASAALPSASGGDPDSTRAALADLHARIGSLPHRMVILLTDGLSGMEESVAQASHREFPDVPVLGGSDGDEERYASTAVFHDGAFHAEESLVAAISTSRAILPFLTHPFFGSSEPLVVTEADARRRLIIEINGNPANAEYARAIGIVPEALAVGHFTANPFVVRVNGVDFVRSIQSILPDGSLKLYCAIKRGVVLRIGKGTSLFENRRTLAKSLRKRLGEIDFVLGFECILNRHTLTESGELEGIGRLYQEARMLGFNTYGEQYQGLHMNQTLTGFAIGREEQR